MELNTQYGNVIIDANTNALVRGQGNYNPPPIYEQTEDRGKAYVDALNHYQVSHKYPEPEKTPIYEQQLTQWGKNEYSVGNAMHPQAAGSWNRNPFGENEYQTFATKAVQQDPSVLIEFFYSTENVDYIQNRIISEVKRIQDVDINRQNTDELMILMTNAYQRALSGWLNHEGGNNNEVYPRGETPCSLENQIARLNKSVLEETVKQVLSGIKMYQTYYKDASSLPLPLSRELYVSQKGSRILSENVGFSSSRDFNIANTSYNERYNIL